MVKQDAFDYRWHEYWELTFQFSDDDTMHVFVFTDYSSALNAYLSAYENEYIEWAAIHQIWYGRLLNQIEDSWQYRPLNWFGVEYALV